MLFESHVRIGFRIKVRIRIKLAFSKPLKITHLKKSFHWYIFPKEDDFFLVIISFSLGVTIVSKVDGIVFWCIPHASIYTCTVTIIAILCFWEIIILNVITIFITCSCSCLFARSTRQTAAWPFTPQRKHWKEIKCRI